MKNLITITLLFTTCQLFANDILTLTNKMSFSGKALRIKNCKVTFKVEKSVYDIPAEEIQTLEFGDPADKVFTNYLRNHDLNNCLLGQQDAFEFHGKQGSHIVLGILFGPFAVIGAALANPTPERGSRTVSKSSNKSLFSDLDYITCYKRKAKGRNAAAAGIGWAIWIIVYGASTLF